MTYFEAAMIFIAGVGLGGAFVIGWGIGGGC